MNNIPIKDIKINPNFRFIFISDTHSFLDPNIYNLIEKNDYVFHAGDIMDTSILDNLKLTCKKVYAVNGNNDSYKQLKDIEVVNSPLGKIVLTHGHKHYPDYHASLRNLFPDAFLVAYGHTHHHIIDTAKRPYIINPGAAGKVRTQGGPSCVIITNSDNGLSIELKKFKPNEDI